MSTDKLHEATDRLVDAFVERVNTRPRERLDSHGVPEPLRLGATDQQGRCDWKIAPSTGSAWLADLLGQLPGRLPPPYLSLVQRYVFPAFALGDVLLFANTGTAGELELATATLRDQALSRVLLREGFVQFGRFRGKNDPVCFDLCGRIGGGECPLVRLDYDEAARGRTKIVARVGESFTSLIS